MSNISKRALFLNVPDPKRHENLASEAFHFATACNCPEPMNYNYDQYQRNAGSDSLRYGGNGSWASPCAQGTQQHVQNRLQVENEVERLYIDFSMEPGFAYDTMGQGRDMIEPRSGGYDGSGAWKSIPMPQHGPPCNAPVGYTPMKTLSGYADPSCLHYSYANQYSG